jgi:hypothetical protein
MADSKWDAALEQPPPCGLICYLLFAILDC